MVHMISIIEYWGGGCQRFHGKYGLSWDLNDGQRMMGVKERAHQVKRHIINRK